MTFSRGMLLAGLLATGCASAPPQAPAVVTPAELTFQQKMAWILRLEEDRVLALPVSAPPPPPPVAAPDRSGRRPVVMPAAPAPQPDLTTLITDEQAGVRRRTALAIGRTRLSAGAPLLIPVLASDVEPEVRQMAAFALGLIGQSNPSGIPNDSPADVATALTTALNDPEPLVQGRAAEALGMIADKTAAPAIGAMVAAHVKAGALQGITPDDLEYPKSPPAEAVRLGLYALVRLGAVDEILTAVSDGAGKPLSHWWPVAYAFQRVANPKAAPVLLALLQGEGAMSRAFAARGLGVIKEQRAVGPLIAAVQRQDEALSVRIQAVRALAAIGSAQAAEPFEKLLVAATVVDPSLRLELITALGAVGRAATVELLIDFLTESWAATRAAALTALARRDTETFLTAISGLDPDPHWSVRASLATALGTLDAARAVPRLTVMLQDADQRVVPAVLAALVAVKAPGLEQVLIDRLAVDDPAVRQAAATGLAQLKATGAAAALTKAYETAERDPTYVARAAILAAIVQLNRDAARPLLEKALADRDWAMRLRAAGLLKSIDPAADISSIRPAPAAAVPAFTNLTALVAPPVSPMAYIDTEKGLIQIELAPIDAPRTVVNFIELARRNFLGGTPFHRVVPDFVVQDGDPRGDGEGGPGYTIRDEINQRPYLRGTVGMALDWEDTGGSQFFITHSPQPHLDGRYTVFGRVVAGMDVVDKLMQWDQIRTVRVWDGVNWIGPK
jgi:cyclophilin family peptidyl-prolyl cis-trans isomerase/HEAT repeat protein